MDIKNRTKGTIVADQVDWADTFWRRLKGLLGTKDLTLGHGLIIKPCSNVEKHGNRSIVLRN